MQKSVQTFAASPVAWVGLLPGSFFLVFALSVVSPVSAFSGYRLLRGGASAGSSGASAGRSVFCIVHTPSLWRCRGFFLSTFFIDFPSFAEISSFASLQFSLPRTEQGSLCTFYLTNLLFSYLSRKPCCVAEVCDSIALVVLYLEYWHNQVRRILSCARMTSFLFFLKMTKLTCLLACFNTAENAFPFKHSVVRQID